MKNNIRKKLLEWCPQPKTSTPRSFTRIFQPSKRSKLIYLIPVLVALLIGVVFLSLPFLLRNDADGWPYSREVDRVSFPGGAIVVREDSQSPSEKGYITISIEANVILDETLAAYIESRTSALNSLLKNVPKNATIEALITFKDPISAEDFASFCKDTIEKPGEYAVILINETTSVRSSEVLWFPRPQEVDFAQNLTSTLEGFKLEGIIAFECYIKADAAISLLSDQKVLLIDPLEDPQVLEIKQDYEAKGFYVQLDRPFFGEMWRQYVTLEL